MYNEGLKQLEQLSLPEPPNNGDNFDVFQNYELRAENRDELKKFLSNNGVGSIIQWAGTPVHQFKKLGFNNKDLPFTDNFFEKCLMLPMNMGISDNEVQFVIDKINEFYK